MLERREEIPSDTFVGVRANIYVEDFGRNIVLRESVNFSNYEEAEAFYDQVENDYKNPDRTWQEFQKSRDEALKYLISRPDQYERTELVEHTADGKRYKLGKAHP